ncbi:MAG: helix-turn-helix domain-containing protein [Thiomonas delicata]
METVSRLMSRFHQAGLVHVAQRQVRITNRDGLAELLVPQERRTIQPGREGRHGQSSHWASRRQPNSHRLSTLAA